MTNIRQRAIDSPPSTGKVRVVEETLAEARTKMKKPTTPHSTKATKAPTCPECAGTSVVPVIHGIPTAAQAKKIAQGQAVAADREEWEGMSEWYCNTCGCDWSRHSRRFKKPGGVNATRGD